MTQERLKEALSYNKEDGKFRWNISKVGRKFGKEVGCKLNSGAIQIMLDYKKYLAHKLAFLYVEGYIPDEVDHKDGNPSNNCWENIRACTKSQNLRNRKIMPTSKTGVKNVHYRKDRNSYVVSLYLNNKRTFISSHKSIEDANAAATLARNKYHGEFARHV